MPPTIVLLAIAALVTVASIHGYRTLTALSVLRSLPSANTDTPLSLTDGEPIALTGEVVVEDPVETGDAAVENAERPVGAYLWRARLPDNTNSDLTIDDWGWERQHWHTFASGIEWGRFCIATDSQTVRIDPTWLRETTGADELDDIEIGGVTNTQRFSVNLWESWYTYLRTRTEHRSFRHFAGHVQRHNTDVDLDRYLLEARPLLDGATISISGKISTEQGEPILRGTNGTPLLLSDRGFDGHRHWLRRRVLRKGAIVAGLLAVAGSLWFEWYVPLAVLIAAVLVYVGYGFVRDMDVFLQWIRD